MILIDPELWQRTRAGARAGRGFRYQDAVAALLAIEAWSGETNWDAVVPEGVDDITLHGNSVEIRAQLKARHDPRGNFSQTEIAAYIAKAAHDLPKNWEQDGRIFLAIVLERPVADLNATGWDNTLQGSEQPLRTLSEALAKAMHTSREAVAPILARTHVVVEGHPLERALPRLETKSDFATGAARLVVQRLREVAGCAADQNYVAQASQPTSIGATTVQAIIDSIAGIVDPQGYLSLTEGLCEVANFDEISTPADFYSGVNVVPGHVGSGLVFDRPHLTVEILEALEAKRVALVAGPSGAGKSALAWLTAFHTRHAVRWYRIRRVATEDIGPLVQLARLLDARIERPVGYMIDDVGRTSTAGWDALVRESESVPGLLLLGTVREEDVFTLTTASTVPTVRPVLDEELAQRIWQALSKTGAAKIGHWRESFERSRGLLLEYTHLLTEGQRLADTINEQVRRRLREQRDDELLILRPVAFAAARGAAVCQVRLRQHLGWEPPRFARALSRLVNEHAVRQRSDGTLTGLHEIRSGYLDEAVRKELGDDLNVTIHEAVHTLSQEDFATFIVRTLRVWPDKRADLIAALSLRAHEAEIFCLVPILHGLGLATADLVAQRWLEISREEELDDRLAGFCLGLAIAAPELGDVPVFAKVKEAQEKFSNVAVDDLRTAFIESISLPDRLHEIDLDIYNQLLATLLPLNGCAKNPDLRININIEGSLFPLIPFLETVRTANEVDSRHAARLVDAVGGSNVLLERLYQELPWVTHPRLVEIDGTPTVCGDVRMVSETFQPDIHADVVRYCELMLAAAPEAEIAVSNAIFPNGRPVGIGDYEVATKRIPRKNLPPPVKVAWHRAQLRAVQRLVGASRETIRTTDLANAIGELSTKLKEAGEYYCRMEIPKPQWKALVHIRGLLNSFVSPPMVNEAMPNALALGDLVSSDNVQNFVDGVQELIVKLTDGVSDKPGLMAGKAAELAKAISALRDPEMWRMTSSPPIELLNSMQPTLWDICDVLCEAAYAPSRRRAAATRFGNSSRKYPALPRAANEARQSAKQDLITRKKSLEQLFAHAGLEVLVCTKEREKDRGTFWPNADYIALLKTNSVVGWLQQVEAFQHVAQSLSDIPRITFAPLVDGCIPPIAVSFILHLLPDPNFASEWSGELPFPILDDMLLNQFSSALDALAALSAIFSEKRRPLNADEDALAAEIAKKFSACAEWLSAQPEVASDACLATACGFLAECYDRVINEFEGQATEQTLAVDVLSWTTGVMTDFAWAVGQCRVSLMERAIAVHRTTGTAKSLEATVVI